MNYRPACLLFSAAFLAASMTSRAEPARVGASKPSGTTAFDADFFQRKAMAEGLTERESKLLLKGKTPTERRRFIEGLAIDEESKQALKKLIDATAHTPPDGVPWPNGGGVPSTSPSTGEVQKLFSGGFVKARPPDGGLSVDAGAATDASQLLEVTTSKLEVGKYQLLIKLTTRLVAPTTSHSECDTTRPNITLTLADGPPIKKELSWKSGIVSPREIPLDYEVKVAGPIVVRIGSNLEVKQASACPMVGERRPAQAAEHSVEGTLSVTQKVRPKSQKPATGQQ